MYHRRKYNGRLLANDLFVLITEIILLKKNQS